MEKMKPEPEYPITVFYRDTGKWVKHNTYHNEQDLVINHGFTDTDEEEDAWAFRATDKYGRELNLRIEAYGIEKFELK